MTDGGLGGRHGDQAQASLEFRQSKSCTGDACGIRLDKGGHDDRWVPWFRGERVIECGAASADLRMLLNLVWKQVIERIEARVARDKYLGTEELNKILREEIADLLSEIESGEASDFSIPEGQKPYVIMVVGVNGVGKTTSIGKLAHQFKKQGLKVVLGAADTFRAAAIDQLQIWTLIAVSAEER